MKRTYVIMTMMVVLVTILIVITPAAAWGASHKVAVIDDYSSSYSDKAYSNMMGYLYYSDYESGGLDLVTVEPSALDAATLATYDTLILFGCNPSVFTPAQLALINTSATQGTLKVIIMDGEDPGTGNGWNYNWLSTPFATKVPGAQGASGVLTIVANNQLASNDAASPFFINANTLSTVGDAVGDANIFTSYVPSQWCVEMTADSALSWMPAGAFPTNLYTNSPATGGMIIYNGLDWDAAGANYGSWPAAGNQLKQIVRNELAASSLSTCSPPQTTLEVTKVADKATYKVGDPVTFTVTVHNPSTYDAVNVGLVDYPPSQVALTSTTANLGTVAAGATQTHTFTGTATAEGCDVKNNVVATGYYGLDPIFTGGDTATFNIGNNCPPPCTGSTCVPEFPSFAVPAAMIVGLIFIIHSMRSGREE